LGGSLLVATNLGKLFSAFSVFNNACFNGGVVLHVGLLYEESGKSSPENGENSGTENAKRSDTELEVIVSFSVLNAIVKLSFTWLCGSLELISRKDNLVRF